MITIDTTPRPPLSRPGCATYDAVWDDGTTCTIFAETDERALKQLHAMEDDSLYTDAPLTGRVVTRRA